METIIFIDDSGSTQYSKNYSSKVEEVIACYESNDIYYWSDTLRRKRGEYSGTNASLISKYIITNPLTIQNKHIVILTDGQIGHHEINICSNMLLDKNIKCDKLTFIIENTSTYKIDDLSVVSPFLTLTNNVTLISESQKTVLHTIDNTELEKLIDTIEDFDSFDKNYQIIFDTISKQSLRINNTSDIIFKLRDMKARITKKIELLRTDLDIEIMTDQEINELWRSENFIPQDLENKVSKIIEISKKNTLNYQNFTFNRISVAPEAKVEIEEKIIDLTRNNSLNYECPILLDHGCPGIMLFNPDGIDNLGLYLHSINQKILNDSIYNPFMFNNFDGIIFKNLIGNTISTEAYLGLIPDGEGNKICPFSRKKIAGFLVLDTIKDTYHFNIWQLRKWIYNGKNIGNISILMMFIYELSLSKEFLINIIPIFKNMIEEIIISQKTCISLCGLATYPQYNVSILRAIQYNLGAERMLKRLNDNQYECFIKFSKLDENKLKTIADLWAIFKQLSLYFKHKQNRVLQENFVTSKINEVINFESFIFPIDDKINKNLNKSFYTIHKYVCENKIDINHISSETFPISLYKILERSEIIKLKPIKNYSYSGFDTYIKPEINIKTCWPKTTMNYNGKIVNAVDFLNNIYKGYGYISLPREFIKLSIEIEGIPTLNEFLYHLQKKYQTFPQFLIEFCTYLVETYNEILKNHYQGDNSKIIFNMKSYISRASRASRE